MRLPKHKSRDDKIPLSDQNGKIPAGAIYKTTRAPDEVLWKYLLENIPTGKLHRFHYALAASILFVCKKNGTLWIYIHYRSLYRLTIHNKYLVPLISKLEDKTRGGKWFTRLDLKNGYNLIRIVVGNEWKTASRTKQQLFKYTVIPFGLTLDPILFQEMKHTIFKEMEECIWYHNDIVIYGSNTDSKHPATVKKVL